MLWFKHDFSAVVQNGRTHWMGLATMWWKYSKKETKCCWNRFLGGLLWTRQQFWDSSETNSPILLSLHSVSSHDSSWKSWMFKFIQWNSPIFQTILIKYHRDHFCYIIRVFLFLDDWNQATSIPNEVQLCLGLNQNFGKLII